MKTVTNCWFWISIWVFVCTLWVSMMGLGSENHTADIEMFIIVVCAEKTMKMSLVCLCKYAMLYMIWGCCCFAFGPKMSNKPDTELLTTDVYFQSVILFYDLQINCFIWVMPLSFYLQAQQLTDAPMWQESSSAAAIWCFPGRAFLLSCQGFFFAFLSSNDARRAHTHTHMWLWWCEMQQGAAISGDGKTERKERAVSSYMQWLLLKLQASVVLTGEEQ